MAGAGGIGHRLCALQPAWQRLSDRAMDATTPIAAGDFRAILPRFTAEARAANQALVDLLGRIGRQHGATPAQITLAWILAQRPWIVPIPGSTKLARISENAGGAALALTPAEVADITVAAAAIPIEGARYPDHIEKTTGL